MIVVAIIGILAAIALPNFQLFSCRAKQSEAKAVLKQIYVGEESYRGEYDTYLGGLTADLVLISVIVVGSSQRYTYSVLPLSTPSQFTGVANGNVPGDMAGDQWQTTELNDITAIANICQ
jgi:type II secretory pathway pseudopilin PulG